MTITDEAAPDEAAPPTTGRRRRTFVSLGVVIVLVVAGAATGTIWYRHYADAPSLSSDNSEFGWLPPDNTASHFKTAGPYTADIAPLRPGKTQGFMFWVTNPSSVTQTVLGVYYPGPAGGRSLTVSTASPSGDGDRNRFEATPVDIPPHSLRAIRYYVRPLPCASKGGGPGWADVDLRVRVGGFVRKETISFYDFEYDLLANRNLPC